MSGRGESSSRGGRGRRRGRGRGGSRPTEAGTIATSSSSSDSDAGSSSEEQQHARDLDSGEDYDEAPIVAPARPRSQKLKAKTSQGALQQEKKREEALLDHFRQLDDELKNAALLGVKNLRETAAQSGSLLENHPVPSKQEVRDMIPQRVDTHWTEQDESDFQQAWEDSEQRRLIKDFTKKQSDAHSQMLPMWKNMIRLCGELPTVLISSYSLLRCSEMTKDQVRDPNWSRRFCRRLSRLVSCGVFQGNKELVHLALLWVGACKTDYRGTFTSWRNPTSDNFLDQLLKAMGDQDGTETIKEVHARVRRRYRDQEPHSFMSKLFRGIEKRAFRRSSGPPNNPLYPLCFDIDSSDLRTVIKATNAIKSKHFQAFHPFAVSSRVIVHELRSFGGYPRTFEDMQSLRLKVAKAELQNTMWMERYGEASSEEQSSPTSERRESSAAAGASRAHKRARSADPFEDDDEAPRPKRPPRSPARPVPEADVGLSFMDEFEQEPAPRSQAEAWPAFNPRPEQEQEPEEEVVEKPAEEPVKELKPEVNPQHEQQPEQELTKAAKPELEPQRVPEPDTVQDSKRAEEHVVAAPARKKPVLVNRPAAKANSAKPVFNIRKPRSRGLDSGITGLRGVAAHPEYSSAEHMTKVSRMNLLVPVAARPKNRSVYRDITKPMDFSRAG